jgi:hypothetical protein
MFATVVGCRVGGGRGHPIKRDSRHFRDIDIAPSGSASGRVRREALPTDRVRPDRIHSELYSYPVDADFPAKPDCFFWAIKPKNGDSGSGFRLILRLAFPCRQMVKCCRFRAIYVPCSLLFTQRATRSGTLKRVNSDLWRTDAAKTSSAVLFVVERPMKSPLWWLGPTSTSVIDASMMQRA